MTTTPDRSARTELPDATYTTVITSSSSAPAGAARVANASTADASSGVRPEIDLDRRAPARVRPVRPVLDPSVARSWRAATEVTAS